MSKMAKRRVVFLLSAFVIGAKMAEIKASKIEVLDFIRQQQAVTVYDLMNA